MEYEDPRDADDAFHDMHNRRVGRDVFVVEVFPLLSPCPFSCNFTNIETSGLRIPPHLLGDLILAGRDLLVMEIVIAALTVVTVTVVIEVIEIILAVTLPVVALLLATETVHLAEKLPLLAEMTETAEEEGARVGPLYAVQPGEEAIGKGVAVQRVIGEEIVIVIAIAMTEMTETT